SPRCPGAMELHVSVEHRARAEALLAGLGVEQNVPLVGINPGASMKAKRWPIERFAAVGCDLAARYDAQILVLGGADDEGRAAAGLVAGKDGAALPHRSEERRAAIGTAV